MTATAGQIGAPEERKLKLQAIEANAIVALKERSAKGGTAAKGKPYTNERARIAAKARWRKPR